MLNRSKDIDILVSEVSRSPKYRNICTDFIRNVGQRELASCRDVRKAIKATKNRLHLVAGSYFGSKVNYRQVLDRLKGAAANCERFMAISRQAMRYHSSTQERLAILDDFYARIFSRLPSVSSILDIGCGLNPLAIPWMPFAGHVNYYACDIYHDLVDFLNGYFQLIDIEGQAMICDVIATTPKTHADVAFLLKMVPCLESVDRSVAVNLIERINARHLVVSFPVQSLGGRYKNMRENYKKRFTVLIGQQNWTHECLEFKSELVFLVSKK